MNEKTKEHICLKCEYEYPHTEGVCARYDHGLHKVYMCVSFTPKKQKPKEKTQ